MKKILSLLMVMFVAVLPVFVDAEEAVAKIGENTYATLEEAVAAVQANETITLLQDTKSAGIKVASGANFTLDFGGHTVTFEKPEVGSAGTETNSMQLLKDSTIVLKNGTLKASSTTKILIQNYSNLTLKDMTIDARTSEYEGIYAVSLNNGTVSIEGATNIYSNKYAIDVYWWPNNNYVNGTQVTIDTTGVVEGIIMVSPDKGASLENIKTTLYVKNINHNGEFTIDDSMKGNVVIEAGTYTDKAVTEIITPAEGSNTYEIITETGEYKVVVEEESKIEQGYFGLGFERESLEEMEENKEILELVDEALAEKYKAAIYYEIVFGDLIDNNFVLGSEIFELESAIKVTLDIPTTLEKVKEGYNRKYVIIRIHENQDGEYEKTILDAKDNGDGTISFETDKFSTYVLAYEDVLNVTNPDTSDGIGLYIILGALSLVGVAVVSIVFKKQQNA